MHRKKVPAEIQYRILSHLTVWNSLPDYMPSVLHNQKICRNTLYYLCLVSRSWYEITNPILWKDPLLFMESELCQLMNKESNLSLVKRLYLKRIKCDPMIWSGPFAFENLKILDIRIPKLDHEWFENMSRHLKHLVSLSLDLYQTDKEGHSSPESCKFWTDSLVHSKDRLASLTHLDLYLISYTIYSKFYTFVSLNVSSKLVHLNLGRTFVSDSILCTLFAHTPHLDSLWLEENYKITDTSLLALARHCPKVQVVKLRNCIHISDDGLIPLITSAKGNLKALGISYTRASHVSLQALSKHSTNLHTIYMNDISIDNEADLIAFITKSGPRFKTLSMGGISVASDKTIHAIAISCTQLQRLDISWCGEDAGISSKAITAMMVITTLENLIYTGIDGIDAQDLLPIDTSQFWLESPLV